MSKACEVKSAKARATIASNIIKNSVHFYRSFDDCFEMNDGDKVMECLITKAKTDRQLAIEILDGKVDRMFDTDSLFKLKESSKECLYMAKCV